jgi:hypothetical protein
MKMGNFWCDAKGISEDRFLVVFKPKGCFFGRKNWEICGF